MPSDVDLCLVTERDAGARTPFAPQMLHDRDGGRTAGVLDERSLAMGSTRVATRVVTV
jgi:hypothetical protein